MADSRRHLGSIEEALARRVCGCQGEPPGACRPQSSRPKHRRPVRSSAKARTAAVKLLHWPCESCLVFTFQACVLGTAGYGIVLWQGVADAQTAVSLERDRSLARANGRRPLVHRGAKFASIPHLAKNRQQKPQSGHHFTHGTLETPVQSAGRKRMARRD